MTADDLSGRGVGDRDRPERPDADRNGPERRDAGRDRPERPDAGRNGPERPDAGRDRRDRRDRRDGRDGRDDAAASGGDVADTGEAVDAASQDANPTPTIRRLEIGDSVIDAEVWPPRPEAGDAAPLVWLHEGLGSRELWRDFPRRVHEATGRRMLNYSRLGYGRSSVVSEPRGVDYMHRAALDVLPRVLAATGFEDAVLVGHSDGASIALIYAGSDRHVGGGPPAVVCLAPHVIVEDRSIEGIAAAKHTFETTDLARKMGRYHTDPEATFWGWNRIWLDPAFRAWDITGYLPSIDRPVLLIQGHDDEYGTMRQLDLIEEGVRGPVQRVELDDCRHAPHLDRPDETLGALVTFLDKFAR